MPLKTLPTEVPINSLVLDAGTQLREELNDRQVQNLVEALERGDTLPPIGVVIDGDKIYPWDGFHRHAAHCRMGAQMVAVDATIGTLRDAMRLAASANGAEQAARSDETKRRQVQVILDDPEWQGWSDNAIAQHCRVSRTLVRSMRQSILSSEQDAPLVKTFERGGKVITMQTGAIGGGFKFAKVKALYDELVEGAFQKHQHGYCFSFNCIQAHRFGFSMLFRTLDDAFEKHPIVEARFRQNQAELEAYLSRSPAPAPQTCKVCIHRRVEEGDNIFRCRAQDAQYLLEQDPGAAGCESFEEYSTKQLPAVARVITPPADRVIIYPGGFEEAASSKLKRMENDFYPTTGELVRQLKAKVRIKGQVNESCAGDGAIAAEFYGSTTNDIALYPGDFTPDFNMDATTLEYWRKVQESGGFDWEVTNPPFKLAPQILPLAFENARVGVAFMLRLSYYEPCSNRAVWLRDNADQMTHLIPINPRPKFRADTNDDDKVTVAWFVWRKDWSWAAKGIDCPFQFITDWR
jgi:hypothetical protein